MIQILIRIVYVTSMRLLNDINHHEVDPAEHSSDVPPKIPTRKCWGLAELAAAILNGFIIGFDRDDDRWKAFEVKVRTYKTTSRNWILYIILERWLTSWLDDFQSWLTELQQFPLVVIWWISLWILLQHQLANLTHQSTDKLRQSLESKKFSKFMHMQRHIPEKKNIPASRQSRPNF